MAYIPKVFTKDGDWVLSADSADEVRLLFEGWTNGQEIVRPRSQLRASLEDIDNAIATLTIADIAGLAEAIDASGGAVDSVAGKTGVVTLGITDIIGLSTALSSAGAVSSVAGKTGAVSLVKGDVGLGNVDNTSDANKPVSTATSTALASKADLVGGVIPDAQLPPLALQDTFVAANQTAMLALTAQKGDVAVRTDVNKTFRLTASPASTLANWQEMPAAGAVTSVAGKTGTVALDAADIATGTFASARLGSGTANSTKYLAGDLTWTTFPTITTYPSASQAEAQAGTGTADRVWTPARVKDAIQSYANARPGDRTTLLYDGSTGFVDPATGAVAAARPSSRTNIYFDLVGGGTGVADPAWMINGDSREII